MEKREAPSLDVRVQRFREELEANQIYDLNGPHHELSSGKHAQKIDFDKIDSESDLYRTWVNLTASAITQFGGSVPGVIIGVANGTNRLAKDLPGHFRQKVAGLCTEKKDGRIKLTDSTIEKIEVIDPKAILIVDDVGTTGGSIAQVYTEVNDVVRRKAESVTAHVTWQRAENLEALDELDISYSSLIKEIWPLFTPEECREAGFCSRGVELIKR